jgi:hypothetical protein
MDKLRMQRVIFLGEKTGPVEQELKRRIIELLRPEMEIESAYLARVGYDDSSPQKVALCLKGGKAQAQEIVHQAGAVFHQMFNSAESLDILFLSPVQEEEIVLVATPFYSRPASFIPST